MVPLLFPHVQRTPTASVPDDAGDRLPSLIVTLREASEVQARLDAVQALGQSRDARTVEPLVATLQDPIGAVRLAAAKALWWVGDARAVEPLIIALNDPLERVAEAAVDALGVLRDTRAVPPLVDALHAQGRYVQLAAARALGRLGGDLALQALLGGLIHRNEDVRIIARQAIPQIEPAWIGLDATRAVVPDIITALTAVDPGVRRDAAGVLGDLCDPRAVLPLIAALDDRVYTVRQAAADALWRIDGVHTSSRLVTVLLREIENIRSAALWGIGRVADLWGVKRSEILTIGNILMAIRQTIARLEQIVTLHSAALETDQLRALACLDGRFAYEFDAHDHMVTREVVDCERLHQLARDALASRGAPA